MLRASFDNVTSAVFLTLDQRIILGFNPGFRLISDTGTVISTGGVLAGGAGSPVPEQSVIKIQYSPGEVAGARGIQLLPGSLFTANNGGIAPDSANVAQAVSPTVTAAVLRKGSKVKFRRATGLKTDAQMRKLRRQFK